MVAGLGIVSDAPGATFATRLFGIPFLLRRTPATDSRSFRRDARERAFQGLIKVRLYLAPTIGLLALAFAIVEPTPWRRITLAVLVVLVLVVSIEEFYRVRARGTGELALPLNVAIMAAAQLTVVVASGGLVSPIIPGLLALAMIGGMLLEPRAILAIVLGIQIPTLFSMAFVHTSAWPVPSLIPEVLGGAQPFEHSDTPWVLASFYSVILVGATRIGLVVRSIFEELFDETARERDRVLEVHAEQNRALTALSAELAHELKNPLSSVKGLAALVAKGAEGKSAERLGVLRQEVDRMQEILEELLTFSRPLVPLSTEEVDLAVEVRDVARLHEATAAERGVVIELATHTPRPLPCDPRKVRQILINLVQNALDASPRGGAISLTIDAEEDDLCVLVGDRGPGVAPELEGRVFEAGVTDKDHGSGLGLVVARSLARQHGGELELGPREGGGCEARLTLPRRPEVA